MSQSEKNVVVLVADDEPSTLALVSSHVRSKGYKVFEASDGDQAWQLAHEHLPDLVILDVMMPGMSGWEVCRKIREAVSLAHTGVVMLTGIGENLNEMTSPLYGADAYLDKPFDFAELDSRVVETLAARRGGAMGRHDPDPGPPSDAPMFNGGVAVQVAGAEQSSKKAAPKKAAPKKAAPKKAAPKKAAPKKAAPKKAAPKKAAPKKAAPKKAAPKKAAPKKAAPKKAAPKKAAPKKAAPKKAAPGKSQKIVRVGSKTKRPA